MLALLLVSGRGRLTSCCSRRRMACEFGLGLFCSSCLKGPVLEHLPMSSFLVAIVLLLGLALNLPGFRASTSDNSSSFVFSGFTGTGSNLLLDGTATVTPAGLLELTNNHENIKGHVFYKTPLQFKDSPPNGTAHSFSATFVFAILPAIPSAATSNPVSTDGMAFIIAPSTNFSDAGAAQFMGFLDGAAMNRTFAVEMDTVQNMELGDIDNNHVGIHNGTKLSMASRTAGFYHDDGTFANLSLGSGEVIQAWVDYDGQTRQINVTLAPMGVSKPSKPLLSNTTDLSAVLASEAYVGFSAATGPIPSQHCLLAWSFAMNGQPPPPIDFNSIPNLPNADNSGHRHAALVKELEIALPVAAVVLIAAACVAVAVVLVRRHLTYAELREDWEVEFGPHRFSYRELHRATEGFNSKHLLGAGGFGKVYKGVLPASGTEVAVKRVSHDSSQGLREFIAEVVSIGRLRHRNLVQLLGYCRRHGELLLVYDYMPNGSLDRYLHGGAGDDDIDGGNNSPPVVLDWARRLQIVKDVASGLLYLHEKWDQVVVHRDVKASNVLLDGGMAAHLGDFGLARLYDHGGAGLQTTTTRVVGTMGYIAPELSRTGKASPGTDVFAFGAFLLEVVCGRRPIADTARHGRVLLVDRVLEYWRRGAVEETVDARLRGECDVVEARMVLTLGLMCSHPFPGERPTMRQVVQYLDGDAPLPELTPADVSLLSLMQNQTSFGQSALQYPWSGISMGTMTTGISVGR